MLLLVLLLFFRCFAAKSVPAITAVIPTTAMIRIITRTSMLTIMRLHPVGAGRASFLYRHVIEWQIKSAVAPLIPRDSSESPVQPG